MIWQRDNNERRLGVSSQKSELSMKPVEKIHISRGRLDLLMPDVE